MRRSNLATKARKEGELQDLENSESVEWFLRSEYDRLTEMLLYTKEMGQKRVQFWLTVISAIGGLLAVIYQINGADAGFLTFTMVALLGILLLGLVIFLKLVQRTITSVEYLRAQGKIKRYFVDKMPKIEKYFYFPVTDDQPKLVHSFAFKLTGSSMRLLVVVINSFLIAAVVAILPRMVYGNWEFVGYQIVMGIAVFVMSFALHEAFTCKLFQQAEKAIADKVAFPSK